MTIDVDFYELPDGTEPVRIFLDGLNQKMKAKLFREIDLLDANGLELRAPHSKHIELAKKYRNSYEDRVNPIIFPEQYGRIP